MRLSDGDLVQYAAALGLDVPRFSSELARHIHAPRVREAFYERRPQRRERHTDLLH